MYKILKAFIIENIKRITFVELNILIIYIDYM